MGEVTKISWATSSHNFWYGCRKVSPECAYCYAERWAQRTGRDFSKVTRTKDFAAPLRWKEPKVIFTCSLSDFFIDEATEWREEAWEVIRKANWHKWLILSKRWDSAAIPFIPWVQEGTEPWPHVIFGASAGNQRMLARLSQMFLVPASGYFLSAEPLFGALDLTRVPFADGNPRHNRNALTGEVCLHGKGVNGNPDITVKLDKRLNHLNWVIGGGESGGPEYRSLVYRNESGHVWDKGKVTYKPKAQALEWVRSIRDQCQSAGVAFHFKQWGGPKPDSAGALLDGREWKEFPAMKGEA